MLRRHAVVTLITIIFASFFVWAGTAVAHEGDIVSADCSSVSASFVDFASTDHPISFSVSVAGGASQTVAAVESPPAFEGAGTATADISALTATLDGTSGSLSVYAFWNGGQTATASVHGHVRHTTDRRHPHRRRRPRPTPPTPPRAPCRYAPVPTVVPAVAGGAPGRTDGGRHRATAG